MDYKRTLCSRMNFTAEQPPHLKQELERRVDAAVTLATLIGKPDWRAPPQMGDPGLQQDLAGFKVVVIPTTNEARKKFGWPEDLVDAALNKDWRCA